MSTTEENKIELSVYKKYNEINLQKSTKNRVYLMNLKKIIKFTKLIIPGLSEPPVRTLRATIPENESHIFR